MTILLIFSNHFLMSTALLAEQFLESTATQLTYYGLEELLSHVNHDEPCVLFRNNHFITLYKRKVMLNVKCSHADYNSFPTE